MFSKYYAIGSVVYAIAGLIMMNVVFKYIKELEEKVAAYDVRYCEKLWWHVAVTETKLNKILVDSLFIIFWPVICIAAILKAEWNYDSIMRRNAFRRNAP